ncbi:hypothetical protein BDR22DRAFT_832407 [Usnea florida]
MDNIITELEFVIVYSLLSLFILFLLLTSSAVFFLSDCTPSAPRDIDLCVEELLEEIQLSSLIVACWKSVTILIVIWRIFAICFGGRGPLRQQIHKDQATQTDLPMHQSGDAQTRQLIQFNIDLS